jgi:hypothetical protein
MNWTVSEKPSLSGNCEANTIPKPANVIAIRTSRAAVSGSESRLFGRKPSGIESRRTSGGLDDRRGEPARGPAQHDRGPAHGRDEDLLQKADVLVREDGEARRRRPEQHREPDDPGDEILEVFHVLGDSGDRRATEAEAEKQQRERERTDDLGGVRRNRFTSRSQSP